MNEVTITGIQPVSEYSGTVFTQSVSLELADGTEITVFDGSRQIESDFIGSNRSVRLIGRMGGSDRISESGEGPDISPIDDQYGDWAYLLRGELNHIDTSGRILPKYGTILELCINGTTVLIIPNKTVKDRIEHGNWFPEDTGIQAIVSRLDISKVE